MMRRLLLAAIALTAISLPVSAQRNFDAECIAINLGDALSVRQAVTTHACSTASAANRRERVFHDLDVSYQAVRTDDEAQWSPTILLNSLYMRQNDDWAVEGGGRVRFTRLRVQMGDTVFDVPLSGASVDGLGCRTTRVGGARIGGCSYRTMAAFHIRGDLAAAIMAAEPGSEIAFRAFFDSGEEVDGTLPLVEFRTFLDTINSI